MRTHRFISIPVLLAVVALGSVVIEARASVDHHEGEVALEYVVMDGTEGQGLALGYTYYPVKRFGVCARLGYNLVSGTSKVDTGLGSVTLVDMDAQAILDVGFRVFANPDSWAVAYFQAGPGAAMSDFLIDGRGGDRDIFPTAHAAVGAAIGDSFFVEGRYQWLDAPEAAGGTTDAVILAVGWRY